MDRKYWEKIAPGYNEEIFDVLKNDRKGLIRSAILKTSGPGKSVIDIGCAIGKWLPLLSGAFKKVMAVDISSGNLSIARRLHRDLTNVEYQRSDMSSGITKFRQFDTAVCINAILTSSLIKRNVFFRNIQKSLKKKGQLILVVPALESWLLTRIIQQRWQIDKKLFTRNLAKEVAAVRYKDMLQGNAEIDDVATKHYLEEELVLLLQREGFTTEPPQKIEYSWKTEFVRPPRWLKQPAPWDWLITAKKK